MTDTLAEHADPKLSKGQPLIEMMDIGKTYGAIRALKGINLTVNAGEVTCVLGDNGAGKSTLIKIMAGLHPHNEGTLKVDGEELHLASPRESLAHGIATVYQDLAVVSLMEVWRNFFLGSEMTGSKFPLSGLKVKEMKRIADEELRKMGIVVKDIDQPIGTLSGGQRQCVAIARAVYFGARVLILDEPTAALGVKQSGVVLKYTAAARDAGLGVVFITHNPHHAFLVGNHFIILKLGQAVLDRKRSEVTHDELTRQMAGGDEAPDPTRAPRHNGSDRGPSWRSAPLRSGGCSARCRRTTPSRSSTRPSTSASPCSTAHPSTGTRRSGWARPWWVAVTRSCWPPRRVATGLQTSTSLLRGCGAASSGAQASPNRPC
jgi:simple sugar transport system ATP-binding protein